MVFGIISSTGNYLYKKGIHLEFVSDLSSIYHSAMNRKEVSYENLSGMGGRLGGGGMGCRFESRIFVKGFALYEGDPIQLI